MAIFKALFPRALLSVVIIIVASTAWAQSPSYGPDITLDAAKKLAAGALAEAQKNKWNVAVAIVDNHGALVYYERMDDTQSASPVIAIEKARSAAMFRRRPGLWKTRSTRGERRSSVYLLPHQSLAGCPSWSQEKSPEASV